MDHHPVEDVCDCGAILTELELRHYGNRCEECERAWTDRVYRWREGGKDEELDRMYASQVTMH